MTLGALLTVTAVLLADVPLGNPILEARRAARAAVDGGAVVVADAGAKPAVDAGSVALDAGVKTPAESPVRPVLDGGLAAALDAGVAPPARPTMTPEVKDLVDRMQAFYEKTRDFTAGFKQDYFYKTFKRTQTSTGKVTYKKPGLMRWDYETPAPKTFVLAGDRVLMHDPAAMLMTIAAINTNTLSASVTFLFGQGRLADEFAITKKDCATCAGTLLLLTPLVPDPRFRQVRLEVEPKSAQVLKSTVVDPDGSENAITFLNLTTNVGVEAKAFKLQKPPGTQVQDFTQPAAKKP